jgi:uncharacterized protein YfaS (alpha-2-macroglobulin family)
VTVKIYRIGDRNLLETVVGDDFQRSLSRYELDRLADERGFKVWSGELAVENPLNTEVPRHSRSTRPSGRSVPAST